MSDMDVDGARRRAVIFGAGAVGRGFIGPLFSADGWHVTFVDVVPDLITRLNEDGSYRQIIVDNRERVVCRISPVDAASVLDSGAVVSALQHADIVATAVGAANLTGLAPAIMAGVEARRGKGGGPLNVLLCENLHDAASVLRSALDEVHEGDTADLVGLVSTSIGRMIPSQGADPADPTAVAVEPYAMLPCDASAFLGPAPDVPGLVPVSDGFMAFAERKLYIHNMGHCMLAYLAHQRSLPFIWQAIEQVEVRYLVRAAMLESAAALATLHGLPLGPLVDHVNDLLRRFGNRALADTAERVGRDPVRKMGANDRLLGAYLLCRRAGTTPPHISLAVALGAHQLASDTGWDEDRIDHHLQQHLFPDGGHEAQWRLLTEQRRLLGAGQSTSSQIELIDEQYASSRVV